MARPLKNGTRCRFRLSDVICPDRGHVVQQVTPELEVTGEIVVLSDHGEQPDRFAIIEVEGIASPLIVAVEYLTLAEDAEGQAGGHKRPIHLESV